MRQILLILFLCLTFQGFACTCMPPEKLNVVRKSEIASSNFIIIGNVIEISQDKLNLTVVVIEVFKGQNLCNDTIVMRNNYYCVPFVDITGEWLFYGNIFENEIYFNECGLSRSLEFPEQNSYFSYAPPPGKEVENSVALETKFEKERSKAKKYAHKKLTEEIEKLRSLRVNKT